MNVIVVESQATDNATITRLTKGEDVNFIFNLSYVIEVPLYVYNTYRGHI